MTNEPHTRRILPDGREATIYVRMFNTIICVGKVGDCFYEDSW